MKKIYKDADFQHVGSIIIKGEITGILESEKHIGLGLPEIETYEEALNLFRCFTEGSIILIAEGSNGGETMPPTFVKCTSLLINPADEIDTAMIQIGGVAIGNGEYSIGGAIYIPVTEELMPKFLEDIAAILGE